VISAMADRKTTVKELMQRTAKLVAVQVKNCALISKEVAMRGVEGVGV